MSKPRYKWWSYAKGMIRDYPGYCNILRDMQEMHTTPVLTGMPRNPGPARAAENAAMRGLNPVAQKEYDAVRRAISVTKRMRNGKERLEVISLVFWARTHTLQGAAMVVPCGWRTAAQWHGDFIRLVASYYGLLE